jgi:hypothetical protein
VGERKASLFESLRYGVNAFVRDKNVIGEIRCLEEDGANRIENNISVAFDERRT